MSDFNSPSREIRDLLKRVRLLEWNASKTSGGHVCFLGPDGQKVFMASTPSDPRSMKNAVAQLRRSGCPL